jgi:hypothetical protein
MKDYQKENTMADHHHPVDINPADAARLQQTWAGFTNLLKYSTITVCVVLALMALAFIR